MQLLDAVAEAGLFGDKTTLWDGNGIKLVRFVTDDIRLYELQLTPEARARSVIQKRLTEFTGYLYDEFEEDGCSVSLYVYDAEAQVVEEAITQYVAA